MTNYYYIQRNNRGIVRMQSFQRMNTWADYCGVLMSNYFAHVALLVAMVMVFVSLIR